MVTSLWILLVVAAGAAGAQELIGLIARGNRGALRSLYDGVSGRAMAIALRILGSTEEAEEIVQDTFVEIWRRASEYRAERGAPAAWIAAMARSRAIDRLRERGRADKAARAMASEPERDPQPLPFESAAQGQERARVRAALASLPAEQRRVVELAYFEGLTQTEIARATGDPLGTVKTRIRLAMEKLAGVLLETPG
ncbi:MAG TPA: sigma-70 family RNA polymerase sigma factor [Myxococcales bacterium]|nr:sigma-70 family RNA polymerase sigma factor [Myxococcales bacterium]